MPTPAGAAPTIKSGNALARRSSLQLHQGKAHMATPLDHDVVRVATAPNPAAAHIWQNALEEEGIKAHVVGEFLDVGIGNVPGFQPEIWVRRDDVARAEEILRDHQPTA